MPVPTGYTLDTPPAATLPPGYTLDSSPAAPAPQKGLLESFADSSGLSAALHPLLHPIDTIASKASNTAEHIQQAVAAAKSGDYKTAFAHALMADPLTGEIIQGAANEGQRVANAAHATAVAARQHGALSDQAVESAIQTIPIAGAAEKTASDQVDAGNASGAVGTGLGFAASMLAPKIIPKVIEAAPALADTIGDTAASLKAKARPASSPAIVPAEEIQAQKIAQSILPPGGIKPELVKSIQAEAPAVVEYAQRTGNPLNTQAEGLKAAQGVAKEGLEHYQQQVLQPVAGRTVALDSANTELGDKATIGDIDSRITKLNKLVNTAPANSAGAALDVLAKSKWTDELGYLRGKLYSSLEHTTGIPAADIQQLREGYGGEFSLANNLEAAQNARLTRTGQAAQGQATIAGKVPTSLADIPAKLYNAARGGEQAISDRDFSSAMKGVKPQAPIRPVPPPIDTDAIAANQAAAQQEAVQQHTLDNAAQDASAQRSQQAQAARMDNKATNASRWASEGYNNVVQHLGIDSSSGIAKADLVKFAQTPQGNSLLTRASSLSPGSPAMRSLVQQIKTKLGTAEVQPVPTATVTPKPAQSIASPPSEPSPITAEDQLQRDTELMQRYDEANGVPFMPSHEVGKMMGWTPEYTYKVNYNRGVQKFLDNRKK